MKAVAHKWAAAAYSGFAMPNDWQKWADSKIEQSEVPDNWVIALSLAKTEDQLTGALRDRLREEELAYGNRIYIGNTKLGYLYWMFKQGRFSVVQFLKAAGIEADCGTGDLDCEDVYAILNELKLRQDQGANHDDLLTKIDLIFHPYIKIAQAQWKELGFA